METLLEEDYIQYHKMTGTYVTYHTTGQGQLSFHDAKACRECKQKNVQICDGQTDKQVFIVNTIREIHEIEIENYFNQFGVGSSASPKERCDLLLYDEHKIVFADMYCGQEKYALSYVNLKGKHNGKIAKVRSQINSTINKLKEVPSIKTRIESYQIKVGIFAVRYKSHHDESCLNEQRDKADDAMLTFLQPDKESNNPLMFSPLSSGFLFTTVTYPNSYSW